MAKSIYQEGENDNPHRVKNKFACHDFKYFFKNSKIQKSALPF
jgi:hypothetical protein